jgi:hypothetical protein
MIDCKCLNVNDVLNNLATRIATEEMARIEDMSDDTYIPSRETLRNVLWTVHFYREEMNTLQEALRNE